ATRSVAARSASASGPTTTTPSRTWRTMGRGFGRRACPASASGSVALGARPAGGPASAWQSPSRSSISTTGGSPSRTGSRAGRGSPFDCLARPARVPRLPTRSHVALNRRALTEVNSPQPDRPEMTDMLHEDDSTKASSPATSPWSRQADAPVRSWSEIAATPATHQGPIVAQAVAPSPAPVRAPARRTAGTVLAAALLSATLASGSTIALVGLTQPARTATPAVPSVTANANPATTGYARTPHVCPR